MAVHPGAPLRLSAIALLMLGGTAACSDDELPTDPLGPRPAFTQVATAPIVTSLGDPGDGLCTDAECTLREAIDFGESGATVTFDVTGTVTLGGTELVIAKDLTITGPGASLLSVDANLMSRVIYVQAGAVTISGLSIIGGEVGENEYGGGILNESTLTVTGCTIDNNFAYYGAGIFSDGTLNVVQSTITNNHGNTGGGLYHGFGPLTMTNTTVAGNSAADGGGIMISHGATLIANSTITGNTAIGDGGGIYAETSSDLTETVTVLNSTITANTAFDGGGIRNYNGLTRVSHTTITGNQAEHGAGIKSWNDAYTRTDLKASIIWGNATPQATPNDLEADYTPTNRFHSLGYNLVGGAGPYVDFALELNATGDQSAVVSAGLDALASNGGYTMTLALQAGSPAIDAGACTDMDGAAVATDQRGVSRPQGAGCDVGAFELEGSGSATPEFTFDLSTLPAATYGDGDFSVAGYASTNSSGLVTFATDASSVGCSVTLAGVVSVYGAAVGSSYCVIAAILAPDATYTGAGPITQVFNIAWAPLGVTANDVTIDFGDPPTFGVGYSGFVGTDDASALGGTLGYTFQGLGSTSYGPSTVAPTAVGSYSITPGGLTSDDYDVSFSSGVLTIQKAATSVTINNLPVSATVGGSFTPTFTSVGDGVPYATSTTTGVCTVAAGVVTFDAVGTCTLRAELPETGNYLGATGTEQGITVGPAGPSFASECTYSVNPKNDARSVLVKWQYADPGVTLVRVIDGRTLSRAMAPTASGQWSTSVKTGTPSYGLWGGSSRKDATTELATGTCELIP